MTTLFFVLIALSVVIILADMCFRIHYRRIASRIAGHEAVVVAERKQKEGTFQILDIDVPMLRITRFVPSSPGLGTTYQVDRRDGVRVPILGRPRWPDWYLEDLVHFRKLEGVSSPLDYETRQERRFSRILSGVPR